ncbi:alcohol dehydrogenase [Paracoccus pantotrophus]|uniref:Probable alcohol dehydrogenase class III n=1 Tax=Paracoccus pantotrophus TaxID=82367 RepID=Q3S8D7_PARPN|nr:zinc-dependent alcohol dehydrogenase family protein [Paracoccus pantotrophus]AAZ93608.1 probable alcohol dehydrogenase class III [Paracoccus pantotrophus]RDD96943.1 alcohol dehydrogenase [Paracoccus pantotrophus]WGR66584.1 alcohol dehydrogenase [Paracoccus pantotrophus]
MKMKAAVLFEQGLPAPYAISQPIQIEEVELDGPGEGEVLIEVVAAGLCHSDLSTIENLRPRKVPTVIGHEAAGIVREVGAGVRRLKVGDHVVATFVASCGCCRYCIDHRANLCTASWTSRAEGTLQSGARRLKFGKGDLHHYTGLSTFAEYAVVSESSLVSIRKDVPLEVAALFGCAVVTGVGAVFNTAALRPGQSAAVVGLGGVGLNALLGAVAAGAYPVIAIDMNPEKLELAKSLGASHAVLASDPNMAEQVKDLTNGGVDFAFEAAGSIPAVHTAYQCLARGGTVISSGLPDPTKTYAYNHAPLVSDEKSIRGSYMGGCDPRRDVPRYLNLYLAGKLPVDRLRSGDLTFEQINQGFDALALGKVVRQTLRPHQ